MPSISITANVRGKRYELEAETVEDVCEAVEEVAGLDALMLGLFTNEDNLHAPDESFNLTIMNRAIDSFEAFFLRLGEV